MDHYQRMVGGEESGGQNNAWVIKLQEIIFSNAHNIQFGL